MKQVQCPNCGGYRIQTQRNYFEERETGRRISLFGCGELALVLFLAIFLGGMATGAGLSLDIEMGTLPLFGILIGGRCFSSPSVLASFTADRPNAALRTLSSISISSAGFVATSGAGRTTPHARS